MVALENLTFLFLGWFWQPFIEAYNYALFISIYNSSFIFNRLSTHLKIVVRKNVVSRSERRILNVVDLRLKTGENKVTKSSVYNVLLRNCWFSNSSLLLYSFRFMHRTLLNECPSWCESQLDLLRMLHFFAPLFHVLFTNSHILLRWQIQVLGSNTICYKIIVGN